MNHPDGKYWCKHRRLGSTQMQVELITGRDGLQRAHGLPGEVRPLDLGAFNADFELDEEVIPTVHDPK